MVQVTASICQTSECNTPLKTKKQDKGDNRQTQSYKKLFTLPETNIAHENPHLS